MPAETECCNTHVSQEQRWKSKQRDQTVNRARGDLLREAEQESQREDVSTGGDITEPESRCPDKVQTNLDPFGETPSPTTELSSEAWGGPQEMDLN